MVYKLIYLSAFLLLFQINDMEKARNDMVEYQIMARGITDPATIKAMQKIPRHEFVPETFKAYAYSDNPLTIGYDQTISQPYIVAYMTEQLELKPHYKVLEIGTGSGYQAAILAEIVDSVYTIEIVEPLANRSRQLLKSLGYNNITVITGDGYAGYPEKAPFDAIIVTAAPNHIPKSLVDQLADKGKMIIPVGDQNHTQYLTIIEKQKDKITENKVLPVRFVPFTREKD